MTWVCSFTTAEAVFSIWWGSSSLTMRREDEEAVIEEKEADGNKEEKGSEVGKKNMKSLKGSDLTFTCCVSDLLACSCRLEGGV